MPDASHVQIPTADVDDLVAALTRREQALSVERALAVPRSEWARPGLYSWWVDDFGAADLSAGLGLRITPGLIYAGLAGATRWPSGRTSGNTLHGRIVGMHIRGTTEFSTFRQTLAATLQAPKREPIDEEHLSRWMAAHLEVVAVAVADADRLGRVERLVLARLDPPLNLLSMTQSPIRQTLTLLRRQLARRAHDFQ